MCIVKGVHSGDEPTKNYYLNTKAYKVSDKVRNIEEQLGAREPDTFLRFRDQN